MNNVMLGAISGLSAGWIAAGFGAVGVVAVIHLLARRRLPRATLPTVAFLARAEAPSRRRRRLRDILLFILRAGAIAAVALAFDRPTWVRAGAPGEDGIELVIVLDASASMQRSLRGRTHFDRAVERAERLLARLDPGSDRAAVIISTSRPESLLPIATANFAGLRGRLRGVEGTLQRADLPAAIEAARALPTGDGAPARSRRIIIITDGQRSQWGDAGIAAVAPRAVVGAVSVAPERDDANLAITGVEETPPAPGDQRSAVVEVENFSDTGAAAALRIIAGNRARSSALSLDAHRQISEIFSLPDEPGEIVVRAAIAADDAFPFDDERVAVVPERRTIRLGLITDEDVGPAFDASFFLSAALAPLEDGPFEIARIEPSDPALADPALGGAFDVIVLAGADPLPQGLIRRLETFGDSGGGIVWVVGSQAQAAALARFEDTEYDAPIEYTPHASTLELGDHARGDAEWSWIRGMEGIRVTATLRHLSRPARQTLLRARSGATVAARWQRGAGRVVIIGAAMSDRERGLVSSPLFPVLMHELAGWAAGERGGAAPEFHVGRPVRVPIPEKIAMGAALVDDLGRSVRVERAGDGFIAIAEPRDAPGLVEIRRSDGEVIARRAVVMDRRESDLRSITEAEMNAALRGDPIEAADGERADVQSRLDEWEGMELWPWLIGAAFCMLFGESLVIGVAARGRLSARERGESRIGAGAGE